jgi:SAM-dependent methyltransferase
MSPLIKKILVALGLAPILTRVKAHLIRLISYPKWLSLQKRPKIFLELGSGAKKGANGWITVDLAGADISYDLSKGIPLRAESVDRIYTSHMLEHIPYRELVAFINECFRVLKPGGELSVCVPDAGRYLHAYFAGRDFRPKGAGYQPAIVDTGSLIDQVNYIAYMDQQHKYMFDTENLINTLKKVPFTHVALREFDPRLDSESRDYESIYAIAIK